MDQLFPLLDTVESDNEDKMDKFMNNSEMEIIDSADIKLTGTKNRCPCCW